MKQPILKVQRYLSLRAIIIKSIGMNTLKSALLFCLFNCAVLFASAQAAAHLKHHHPLPLSLCTIKAGSSVDSSVVKLFGEGVFEKNERHGGARYFTDESKKIILKTVIGTDHVIEEVALCSYKLPFDFINDKLQSIPVTKNLNVQSIMIGNIHIGDKREKIVQQFGDPNKTELVNGIRKLRYEDTRGEWKSVLMYNAAFEFKDDRLERISIYNGD
jgi:hypothetical protein